MANPNGPSDSGKPQPNPNWGGLIALFGFAGLLCFALYWVLQPILYAFFGFFRALHG